MEDDKKCCGNDRPQRDDSESLNTVISRNPSSREFDVSSDTDAKVKIKDIVLKQLDYGYLVKVGCVTLAIETREKLNLWMQDYICDPETVTMKWNEDYYNNTNTYLQEITVGVIARSLEDFMIWSDMFPKLWKTKSALSRFTVTLVDNQDRRKAITYHCLSTITACKGMTLDKIVETNKARENKDFEAIVETSRPCLRPQ